MGYHVGSERAEEIRWHQVTGGKLEITEKDGVIQIMPVVVYPKRYLDELKQEITDIKNKIDTGDRPIFDNVEALFQQLDFQET